MKNIYLMAFMAAISLIIISSCGNKKDKGGDMKSELQAFIKKYEDTIRPVMKEYTTAMWNSEISGSEADYAKVEEVGIRYSKIFTNKEDFALLKKIKDAGGVKDSLLDRELLVLFNAYQRNQVDEKKLEEIISMETKIAKKMNTYRATTEKGDSITDNQVEDILINSTDNKKLEETWKAHKKVGHVVSADIITLVKKRNAVAKDLGYNNYHEMSLKLSEQDPAEIENLFNELDELTRDGFAKLKSQIDSFLSKRYNVPIAELKPWHFQGRFFQEAPKIYTLDLDKYYKDKDLVKLTADYYASLGMDVKDIIDRSDLFEKKGKNQHAFCIDMDNEGDVRVLCNVKPNYKWMNTMLHEFGHGVYDKYISRDLPLALREPAHTFTTEAIAMMFGRLASNAQWMQDMLGISDNEKAKIKDEAFKYMRLEQLVFSRWSQVMYRFEKGLYENPDQDLNKLWWDLVEKYQLMKKPEGRNEPDWASKIHIATSPCYYHNYHLGELLASQLNHYIVVNIMKQDDINGASYYNNKEVGKYLMDKVFAPGSQHSWNEMIKRATGEELTAKYYAEQFVDGL
ncbi:MAG: M2 family metallopeptidase [Bacteroidales bacterium]|jgi:peptidyl-dipeptidase A|nr:M2 family metallopeptidase [Bacteroidales bacterium]